MGAATRRLMSNRQLDEESFVGFITDGEVGLQRGSESHQNRANLRNF